MYTTRQNKISRLIQKEMSDIFIREGSMIAPGAMITVSVVRVSPDFSLAKVYLSIFSKSDNQQVIERIKNKTSHFRHELGKRVRHQLRKIPELVFAEDDSLDYIENIENILDKDKSKSE